MNDAPEERDRPRTMLIADDDPAILGLLVDYCVQMGFQVDTAMNGVQLLVKARQNHPDILVADVNMPERLGIFVGLRTRLLDELRGRVGQNLSRHGAQDGGDSGAAKRRACAPSAGAGGRRRPRL